METFGAAHDRHLTPPEPKDCTRCESDGCDGAGFIPDEPRIAENICCDCPCHGDPEIALQMEYEHRMDLQKEDRIGGNENEQRA